MKNVLIALQINLVEIKHCFMCVVVCLAKHIANPSPEARSAEARGRPEQEPVPHQKVIPEIRVRLEILHLLFHLYIEGNTEFEFINHILNFHFT